MKSDVPPQIFVGIMCKLLQKMGFYDSSTSPDISKINLHHENKFNDVAGGINLSNSLKSKASRPFARILTIFYLNQKEITENTKNCPFFDFSSLDIDKKLPCHLF